MKARAAWYQNWAVTIKGGPGSGHATHAGRVGYRGGSRPGWAKGVFSVKPLSAGLKGVNKTQLVRFEDGTRAIFKPDVDTLGSGVCEVLSYRVSKSLGWDVVPETTEFKVNGVSGSLQKWVEGSQTAMDVGLYNSGSLAEINDKDYARINALDALCGIGDRHMGNVLLEDDVPPRIKAIDNGVSFGFWKRAKGSPKISHMRNSGPKKPRGKMGKEERASWDRIARWAKSKASKRVDRDIQRKLGPEIAQEWRNRLNWVYDWEGIS